MPGSSNLRTGLWYDHSSNRLARLQYTESQGWTLWMTSLMAAALTLATPFLARILVASGAWCIVKFHHWKDKETTRQPSSAEDQAEQQPLLSGGAPIGYDGSGGHGPTQQDNSQATGRAGSSLPSPGDAGSSSSVQRSSIDVSDARDGRPLSPTSSITVPSATGSAASHTVPPANADADPTMPRRRDALDPGTETNGHASGASRAGDGPNGVSRSSKRVRDDSIYHYVAAIIGIFAVIVMLFVGVFAPKIVTESAGIAASRSCGQWEYDRNASSEERLRDFERSYLKEDRAAQYAQNCYGLSKARLDNSLACERFYHEDIKFVEDDAQCPFKNKTICLETYGAVAFSTGFVPASHLGINTGSPDFKFRRNTTCSPITLDGHWTRNASRYYYYYGEKLDANTPFTYYTDADVLEWEIPQYSLDVYFYDSLNQGRHNWVPIDDLLPDVDGGSVSLMFVSSHHLWHYEQSNDPIFPATSTSPSRRGWYYNGDLKARPLACVDSTEICAGGKCGLMDATTLSNDRAWWLMKISLERSNTYESIRHRLGSGLLAQQKISGYWTRGLAPDQWKVESRGLFATSLSRIQWDLSSIATGEDAHVRGYKDYTPDEAKGRICGQYKFNKKGYSNINAKAFWGILAACVLIVVAAWPRNFSFGAQDRGEMLVEVLLRTRVLLSLVPLMLLALLLLLLLW